MARTLLLLAYLLFDAAAFAQDLPEIRGRGVLRVIAARDEQPEVFSFGGGSTPGLEREMIDGFARLHKLSVEYIAAPGFAERTALLLQGQGDVVVGVIVTDERRRSMAFTSEVLPARHVAVSLRPRPVIDGLAALRSAKVGVLKGSTWAKAAVDAGVASEGLVEFTNTQDLFDGLEKGQVTATVMPVVDLTLAMRRHPRLQAGTPVGPDGSAAWAVRKDAEELRAALDAYLSHSRQAGARNRLLVKYFGSHALTVLNR